MMQNIMDDEDKKVQLAFDTLFKLKNPAAAKKYVYDSAHTMSIHNHDYPQVWYCLDGEYTHRVEDRTYTCRKGSVIIVPPGVFHRFYVPGDGYVSLWRIEVRYNIFLGTQPHLYTNAIAGLFLPPFQKELGWRCPEYTELSEASAEIIEDCIFRLVMMELSPQPATCEHCCEVLEDLFSLRELALPQKLRQKAVNLGQNRMRPIVRVLDYLNSNYPQRITAQELQQVSTMCQREFFRSFKLFTGYTYSVYLQQLRVWRARDYMTFTKYSLALISDICGFTDQAHMTNCCKKYLGITPKEVRARMLEYRQNHPDYKRDVRAF